MIAARKDNIQMRASLPFISPSPLLFLLLIVPLLNAAQPRLSPSLPPNSEEVTLGCSHPAEDGGVILPVLAFPISGQDLVQRKGREGAEKGPGTSAWLHTPARAAAEQSSQQQERKSQVAQPGKEC